MGWNSDMSAAPRDGTRIWAFFPGIVVPGRKKGTTRRTQDRQVSVFWQNSPKSRDGHELSVFALGLVEKHGGFWTSHANGHRPTEGAPSHWMPLPEPPK